MPFNVLHMRTQMCLLVVIFFPAASELMLFVMHRLYRPHWGIIHCVARRRMHYRNYR